MENELDTKRYLRALIRRWKVIVTTAVVAGLVALLVSCLIPPWYKATALVIISEPRYQMQLDDRIETTTGLLAQYEVFPALATSDDVLRTVMERYTPIEIKSGSWTLHSLQKMAEAGSRGDPSLVVLTIECSSATDASGIVNVWAEVLTERSRELYGEGDEQVQFFSDQVEVAQRALEVAEEDLIEFQGRNQGSILRTELDSYSNAQLDYLEDQRGISYLLQDIDALRNQLSELPTGSQATFGDDLTALFIQITSFNAGTSLPIQLQVSSAESLTNRTIDEQIDFLDSLAATLETKSTEIGRRIDQLVLPILTTQQELEIVQAEANSLDLIRELAWEEYTVLARRLQEANLSASEEEGVAQVASYAAVPVVPAGPLTFSNCALSTLLGLAIGVFAVLVVDWWNQDA